MKAFSYPLHLWQHNAAKRHRKTRPNMGKWNFSWSIRFCKRKQGTGKKLSISSRWKIWTSSSCWHSSSLWDFIIRTAQGGPAHILAAKLGGWPYWSFEVLLWFQGIVTAHKQLCYVCIGTEVKTGFWTCTSPCCSRWSPCWRNHHSCWACHKDNLFPAAAKQPSWVWLPSIVALSPRKGGRRPSRSGCNSSIIHFPKHLQFWILLLLPPPTKRKNRKHTHTHSLSLSLSLSLFYF